MTRPENRDRTLLSRREAFALMAGVGVASVLPGASADPVPTDHAGIPPAYRDDARPKPLPFDPTALHGLSAQLVCEHHAHHYAGAVRYLNAIRRQLARLPPDASPSQRGALKHEELVAMNATLLHEAHFAALGGDGRARGRIADAIRARYGSLATWVHDFRETALSLHNAGWVVLAYDPYEQTVHNYWCGDHAHASAGGAPLLVLDMYEHAWAPDFGTNAIRWVDAFLANIRWDEVDRRADVARGLVR